MIKRVFLTLCILFGISAGVSAEENKSAYILMESDTRQVIKKENENMQLPIASTTKIMTAITAIENANLTDIFTVSENAQNQEGSSIYLRTGDKISVQNLLYGLMLNSGNDAATALAEGVSGSVEAFSRLMNDKAAEIGCKNTNFKNPSGLNEEGHYSSAYDMALIMAYAMENEEFGKIISTKRYNIEQNGSITYLKNHNKLLWQYDYCIGGKTGFTKLSGRCLVTAAEKDGIRLVAVTLNNPDDWAVHKELFDYGFCELKNTIIIDKNSILATKTINGTKVNLVAEKEVNLPLIKGKRAEITGKIHLKEYPSEIKIGDVLGYADIYLNKYPVAKIKVISGQRVKKQPFDFIKRLLLKRVKKDIGSKSVIDFEPDVFDI